MSDTIVTSVIGMIGVVIVAALGGGGIFAFINSRRTLPSEIRQTEAKTGSIEVSTETIEIENQRKRDERFDYIVTRTENDAIARIKLYDEIETMKRRELLRIDERAADKQEIGDLKEQVKKLLDGDVLKDRQIIDLTRRAEFAEHEIITMHEYVPDEILRLREELNSWKEIAGGMNKARNKEAENAGVVAENTAAALKGTTVSPAVPVAAPDGSVSINIPADTAVKLIDET